MALVSGRKPADRSEAAADAELFGFPDQLVAKIAGSEEAKGDGDFGVWPENWDTVRAFEQICGQWRVASLSSMTSTRLYYVGLDYAAVRAGLICARIRITADLWDGIRTMEAAMRRELNK